MSTKEELNEKIDQLHSSFDKRIDVLEKSVYAEINSIKESQLHFLTSTKDELNIHKLEVERLALNVSFRDKQLDEDEQFTRIINLEKATHNGLQHGRKWNWMEFLRILVTIPSNWRLLSY